MLALNDDFNTDMNYLIFGRVFCETRISNKECWELFVLSWYTLQTKKGSGRLGSLITMMGRANACAEPTFKCKEHAINPRFCVFCVYLARARDGQKGKEWDLFRGWLLIALVGLYMLLVWSAATYLCLEGLIPLDLTKDDDSSTRLPQRTCAEYRYFFLTCVRRHVSH